MRKLSLNIGLILLFPVTLFSADTSKNPNRWPSITLTAGGKTIMDGEQKFSFQGTKDERKSGQLDINSLVEWIKPLSNQWSVLVGLGGIFSHFKLDETSARSGSKTDSQFISYKVGLTRFISDRPSEAWKVYRNPDRYTSVSLVVSGGVTIGSELHQVVQGNKRFQEEPRTQRHVALLAMSAPYRRMSVTMAAGGTLETSSLSWVWNMIWAYWSSRGGYRVDRGIRNLASNSMEGASDFFKGFTTGLGLKVGSARMDYAIGQTAPGFGTSHRIALTLSWGGRNKSSGNHDDVHQRTRRTNIVSQRSNKRS